MKDRILVCWIGHTDMRAMAAGFPPERREAMFAEIGAGPPGEVASPVRALLKNVQFSAVHLLSTYGRADNGAFASWIGQNASIHPAPLKDPTDYPSVYEAAAGALADITKPLAAGTYELCLHLSPGTPTMAAIWVLLGKSLYPATFYQTYKGGAKKVAIPFDLTVDYLPELLRRREEALQAVVEGGVTPPGFEGIIGQSREIKAAIDRARRVAVSLVPALILGESGTGKELFARAIHDASPRHDKSFIAINCAALPRELLESELFGHAKGAFTGAGEKRPGAFEQAHGGTLFLDEVGECDPALQAKLLRVLQPPKGQGPCVRVFRPVGASKDITADVRVIAATNRAIGPDARGGSFRADLYYRLAVVTIHLPALRSRGGDIPLLAQRMLETINEEFARQLGNQYQHKKLSPSANQFVQQHSWPGNVRELYNLLTQAVIMTDGTTIGRADLEGGIYTGGPPGAEAIFNGPIPRDFNLESHLDDIQRAWLKRAMEQSGRVKTKAAALLGLRNYQTLDAQLKRLDVRV